MSVKEKIKEILKPKLKLLPGTRLTSFLFIAASIAIAFGILFAANIYYNIDTGQIVSEQVMNIFGANNQLRFERNGYYIAFQAPSLSTSSVYTLPTSTAPAADYLLASADSSGTLIWKNLADLGGGTITMVGDVSSGHAFTSDVGTQYGTTLWFHPNATYTMALTASDGNLTANATTIIPAVSGTNYLTLGTGTNDYVAYWTGTNTLSGEQYLSTTRGGTGQNSSGWNGMVKVVGGVWSTTQGTAGYAAYWSDANTVAAEQFLATSRGGLGANVTAAGAGEILYSTGATTYGHLAAGSPYQVLTSGGAAAPVWRNISDLVFADNGLTRSTGVTTTLTLGGSLIQNTTISLGNYNMVFSLATGGGQFQVATSGGPVLSVTPDERILFKNSYPIAQAGKQVLREMVPIFGFDLPAKTTTTTYTQISRTIVNYPLNPCYSGTSRVHKLVIRYGATATSSWQVATSTTGGYAPFLLSPTNSTSTGSVYTATTDIPTPSGACTLWSQGTETEDWWVQMKLDYSGEIIIYQIFLAGYDQIL